MSHIRSMRSFLCPCGNPLFFGSSRCLACQNDVAYDPAGDRMIRPGLDNEMVLCANGLNHGVCNWAVPAGPGNGLCLSCRMNRVVPLLSSPRERELWGKMEMAKRRMLHSLIGLGITLFDKSVDARDGLAFEVVSTRLDPSITTGHLNGTITVDLEEADEVYRVVNRERLGESSRTLLGHFRHECGHYLWHRFMSNLEWGDPCRLAFRERFGNEWLDYAQALGAHYQFGAPLGWNDSYISAYASSHPWEDWAETWAHYLLMMDALQTSFSLGLRAGSLALPEVNLGPDAATLPDCLEAPPGANDHFLRLLGEWLALATVLNELADSVGEARPYPFVISMAVARKLRLAHHFASIWAGGRRGNPILQ